jgi:spoIIIJ-associated protein
VSAGTDQAKTFLENLLIKLGVNGTVTVEEAEPPVLSIESEDAATLIGHRGEVMRSLQHLLRVMLVRSGTDLPVLVDVEGYRERQQEQLKVDAQQKADDVARTGRLAMLPPMSSYERRLVHMALAERTDVVTESIGEGGGRRLMIKKSE